MKWIRRRRTAAWRGLCRQVHRPAASAVLQGRRGAGGQEQTHSSLVSLKARSMEGRLVFLIREVDDSAPTKEQVHGFRMAHKCCFKERGISVRTLPVEVKVKVKVKDKVEVEVKQSQSQSQRPSRS